MVQLWTHCIRCCSHGPCKVCFFSLSAWEQRATYSSEPRNYVTQDILRRILSDYFGYDIHFVMNITDIDDKVDIPSNTVLPWNRHVMQIILRARQAFLLNKFKSEATSLTVTLLDEVRTSWDSYVRFKVCKGLPSEQVPPSGSEWQAWSELSIKAADKAWKNEALKRYEKFDMYFTAAVRSHVCQSGHVSIMPP